MREEDHIDFSEVQPLRRSMKMSLGLICLTLLVSLVLLQVKLAGLRDVPLWLIGVLFCAGSGIVLILLNVMICNLVWVCSRTALSGDR